MDTLRSVSGRKIADIKAASDTGKQARVKGKELLKLKTACQQMEGLFVQEMLKSMRKTVAKSELFHGGRAEEIYTGLYDQEISREIVETEGIGLYRMLYDQLKNRLPESE